VARTEFDRFNCSSDAGVTGEHDDQHLRIVCMQRLHARQS
jgi:hypothetical protein